jgi:hypothetical protein
MGSNLLLNRRKFVKTDSSWSYPGYALGSLESGLLTAQEVGHARSC